MGKIVSRGIVTKSKETIDVQKGLHIAYCLCGEFLLVTTASLQALPRRPVDNSYVLINEGKRKRVYKLNYVESPAAEAEGKLIHRGEGQFEFQRQLHCSRCSLPIGYETEAGRGRRGKATFLLAGALTAVQSVIPEDAFGREVVEN